MWGNCGSHFLHHARLAAQFSLPALRKPFAYGTRSLRGLASLRAHDDLTRPREGFVTIMIADFKVVKTNSAHMSIPIPLLQLCPNAYRVHASSFLSPSLRLRQIVSIARCIDSHILLLVCARNHCQRPLARVNTSHVDHVSVITWHDGKITTGEEHPERINMDVVSIIVLGKPAGAVIWRAKAAGGGVSGLGSILNHMVAFKSCNCFSSTRPRASHLSAFRGLPSLLLVGGAELINRSKPRSLQAGSFTFCVARWMPKAACWSGTMSSSSSGLMGWCCGGT